MKKFVIVLLLSVLPSVAFAQAHALIISQRNATDNGIVSRLVLSPVNTHGFFYHEPLTRIPRWGKFGPNCTVVLDILNCKGTDIASISDASVFGKDWLTLSDVGAAQELLDVPTDTADLTNGAGFITSSAVTVVNGQVGEVELDHTNVGAAAATHTHDSSSITTGTLSVSRIPDLSIGKITDLEEALDEKMNVPVGTTSQVVRGDGSLGTLDAAAVGADASGAAANAQSYSIQRANHTGTQTLSTISDAGTAATLNVSVSGNASATQVVKGNDTRLGVRYAGSTNGSGVYAVTYGSAYTTTPHIVFAVVGGTNKDTAILTSTTSGFSILVERRSDVLGLLPSYAPVTSGVTVNVTVVPN